MRFIPTRVHGALDFVVGLLMILAPWLFGFARNGAETWVFVVLGVGALGYSLLTNYEWGVLPVLSMRAHLWMDAASGVFLAASPWIFGFANYVWLPHLIIGLFEVAAAGTTRTVPSVVREMGQPTGWRFTGRSLR